MLSSILSAVVAFGTLAASTPTCSYITPSEASRVSQAFSAASLFPSVVPSFIPTVEINTAFGTKAVDLGTVFTTPETLTEPTYSISAEQGYDPATTKYFFFLLDPDAPGPNSPALLQVLVDDFLHLAVQDVQPSCITSQTPSVIRPYLSLTPLSLPAHRYTFLAYRQPKNFVAPATLRATIFGLKLGEFVDKYGLVLVGGNFLTEGIASNVPA
ncbi:MAG: hypothetical protein MMC23_004043 [Stictis urceolatum]|nr:hypothetical protein [Stictis urceolata]